MEIVLDDGAVLGIDGRHGLCAVRCLEGALYVTRTGDPRDYCLGPGEQMEIGKRDHVVVEAWGAARLKCTAADAKASRSRGAEVWHLVGSA
ncbi:hypothetical protein GMSM_18700 [Geomonas sp. Red276]